MRIGRFRRNPWTGSRIFRSAVAALACCPFALPVALAQPSVSGYIVDRWTTADGLPVNGLTDVVRSRNGYLWIATWDGLVRFDGARFTVFNRTNTPGLPSNRLFELYETRDGILWIRTEHDQLAALRGGAVSVYGPHEGLHGSNVSGLFADRDSTLLVATEQGIYAWEEGRFAERWRLRPSSGITADRFSASAVTRDARGTLWIGTYEAGLLRDRGDRTDVFTHADGLPLATITGVVEDDAGRIWVSASPWQVNRQHDNARGLFLVEGDSLRSRDFGPPERPVAWASGLRILWRGPERAIASFGGRVFIGSATAVAPGLNRWIWSVPADLGPVADGPFSYLGWDIVYREDGFVLPLAQHPYAALWDREGSLWIATNGEGLWRYRPNPFRTIRDSTRRLLDNIYPVLVDRRGLVWTAQQGLSGVVQIDPWSSDAPRVVLDGEGVLSLYEDRGGTVWVGTNTGVCRFPSALQAPASSDCAWLDFPGSAPGPIYATYQDAGGGYWLAGDHTLWRYADGAVTQQRGAFAERSPEPTPASGAAFRPGRRGAPPSAIRLARQSVIGAAPRSVIRLARQSRPQPQRIRAIAEDTDGNLWFGFASGGLSVFEPDPFAGYREGRFHRFSVADGLPSESIRDLYADDEGFVWVVTEDAGLARIDSRGVETPAEARIVVIRRRDGLPEDALHSMQADDDGRFWVSSNRGLFWVDRSELNAFADTGSGTFRTALYTERDGLVNKEFNGGFRPASGRDTRGRLWFPSQAGLVVFDPADVRVGPSPATAIEALSAAGHSLPAFGPITLDAGDRTFDITYTAFSFLVPEEARFRYRLDPYDDGWVDAGTRRTAYYTQVRAGAYTFRVSAAGKDGTWSEAESALRVTVRPYFHETIWFAALALVALVGLVGAGIRLRVRQLNASRRHLESVVADRTREVLDQKSRAEEALSTVAAQAEQLRSLDAAKSRFFANISHEFRTPLTLILGPVEQMLSHPDVPAPTKEPLGLIHRNASRLSHLINQLLDLARLDAGGMALDASGHDLAEFVRQTAALFESLARLRGVTLAFETLDATLPWVFDADKLEKVVMNLLSNALKFTPPGGTVTLTLGRDVDGGVRITVEDTGIGIPEEHLAHVFDRFYQVDDTSTRRLEGSGVGLALAHDLVVLHGGRLEVTSRPGIGTAFTIALPAIGEASEDGAAGREPAGRLPEDLAAAIGIEGAADRYVPHADDDSKAADSDRGGPPAPLVLVVEDNADLRGYVRSILMPEFDMIEAADGTSGFDQAAGRIPDLVLSDVMMPGMDGLELCRNLKADPRTSHVPVVLLTARDDLSSRLGGLETGADDYLAKPFHPEELRLRLRNLVDQRRMLRTRFSQQVLVLGADEVSLPSREVDFLARLKEVIHANLSDAEFGVDALADAVGMSRSQIGRKLQALLGESPGSLIRRIRLERAAQMLRQGGEQVKAVAAAVGYRSMPHFSEAFRQTYGVSPSAFGEPADE